MQQPPWGTACSKANPCICWYSSGTTPWESSRCTVLYRYVLYCTGTCSARPQCRPKTIHITTGQPLHACTSRKNASHPQDITPAGCLCKGMPACLDYEHMQQELQTGWCCRTRKLQHAKSRAPQHTSQLCTACRHTVLYTATPEPSHSHPSQKCSMGCQPHHAPNAAIKPVALPRKLSAVADVHNKHMLSASRATTGQHTSAHFC